MFFQRKPHIRKVFVTKTSICVKFLQKNSCCDFWLYLFHLYRLIFLFTTNIRKSPVRKVNLQNFDYNAANLCTCIDFLVNFFSSCNLLSLFSVQSNQNMLLSFPPIVLISFVTLYWMQYWLLTYDFEFFVFF